MNNKTVNKIQAESQFQVGDVVRSKCGRDRKRIFLVVEIDETDKYAPVVIANGTLRKLEDRKHKNPTHLERICALGKSDIFELEKYLTNSKIAEICDKCDIQQKK